MAAEYEACVLQEDVIKYDLGCYGGSMVVVALHKILVAPFSVDHMPASFVQHST